MPKIGEIWAILSDPDFLEKITFFQSFTITKTQLHAKNQENPTYLSGENYLYRGTTVTVQTDGGG